jgi:hypothetical protein
MYIVEIPLKIIFLEDGHRVVELCFGCNNVSSAKYSGTVITLMAIALFVLIN